MVNTGHPSEGCLQCRNRKVKCDAKRPGCDRCAKLGIPCPGYPEKTTLAFRDDTERTRNRAKRIYQSLSKRENRDVAVRPPGSSNSSSSDTGDSRPSSSEGGPSFGSPPDLLPLSFFKDVLATGSVSSFLNQFNQEGVMIVQSNFSLAGILYPTCVKCLAAALETMSLWNLSVARESANTEVHLSVMKMYGRTLAEIHRAIQNPSEPEIDQILLAIEIVSVFEGLAEPGGMVNRAPAHIYGLLAMIGKRGPAQFASEIGRRAFLDSMVFFNVGSVVLKRPKKLPLPADICDVLLKTPLAAECPEYRLLPLLQRSLVLRIFATEIFEKEDPLRSQTDVQSVRRKARKLDNDLRAWFETLPEPMRTSRETWKIMALNLCRIHQILMQDLLVRCYYILQRSDAQESLVKRDIARCLLRTQELVDAIRASSQYTFDANDPALQGPPVSGKHILGHLAYSHPLLVCSMVQSISDEEIEGIEFARKACAAGMGVTEPFRRFRKCLMLEKQRYLVPPLPPPPSPSPPRTRGSPIASQA